ncbi:MAG: hypothetical protein Q8R02_04145 [Hyphomonadaceae bacterium]|nr:hypothetical protein [Hyphomonadaceae bacterium]
MATGHWVSSRDYDSDNAGEHRIPVSENIRGAIVLVLASAALVGLAFGVMLLLTSPDGWASKAAQSAASGEDVSLISYDVSSAD